MWSNLWDVWCPSVFLSTEWVSDYVCVCVSTTVLLVSSYIDGAVCRNGPHWQAWPWQVNVHYHMKPKCQAWPPAIAICLSLWVSWPGHTHTHANTLTYSCLTSLICTNILHNEEVYRKISTIGDCIDFPMYLNTHLACFSISKDELIETGSFLLLLLFINTRNSFPPTNLKLSLLLTDSLTGPSCWPTVV